jgi:hypothetical protein
MQPSLNLRIPDFSKSPSPQLGLIKPCKSVSFSSPYNRILSSKSLKTLFIPSFLHPSQSHDQVPSKKNSSHLSSEVATNTSSIKTEDSKMLQKSEPRSYRQIFDLVFNKSQDANELLLKVGQQSLTRGDLQTLEPDSRIDRKVIDACLRCFKHINRKQFKSNEENERVLIIDTSYSESVFTSRVQPMTGRNPLKYNKVLFPLFLGYWTLVSLDNQCIKLSIFNVFDEETTRKITLSVNEFIKQQLKYHEKKNLESSGWRDLVVENLQTSPTSENYEPVSGGLALRLAYKLAVKPSAEVELKTLPNFRFKLLVILFNHGIVKICN